MEQFKKLGPFVFQGTTDLMVTEAWLKQMQKIFIAMRCSDNQKVVFVTFMLQGEVDHWWEATSHLLRNQLPSLGIGLRRLSMRNTFLIMCALRRRLIFLV